VLDIGLWADIAQAYTGVTSMIGDAGKAPPLIGVAVGDVGAAVSAVAAINGALFHQERHGGSGQYLDISLIDFYFLSHSINVEALSASAGAVQPTRSGSQHMHVAPCGVFKGRDRHIIILAVTQDMWLPRFRTVEDRMVNRDVLVQIIERWLQSEQKVAAALHTLQSARVPCAPVLTVAEAMAEPHLVERLTVRTIEDPTVGAFQIPGTPLRFSGDHDIASRRAPYLGEHNEEILTEELDYSAAAVRQLEAQGVLVSEPVPVDAATK
jgi:crotonobetainyl-CoA:carnitine CoA-transferase CaiB-like acyl-CoA transferase